MEAILDRLTKTIQHLLALHDTFNIEGNYIGNETNDYQIYQDNLDRLQTHLTALNYRKQLYSMDGRQMILSDFFEYVFFGRIHYSLKKETAERGDFIASVLSFVNILMCFESVTISDNLRRIFLNNLAQRVPEVMLEPNFNNMLTFTGKVGLPQRDSDATPELNKYFDSLLPKTAGGLWHELLVYIFLLRNDCGYIIPLLLSQRLIGLKDYIIPPDFLLLSKEKRLFGIEVGTGKEIIQSSAFVLRTAIPTATVDTINSRTDRCPICKKWIGFCPFVIEKYSDIEYKIPKPEIKCLSVCNKFEQSEIIAGVCPYSKYQRAQTKQNHTHHSFANTLHYHYQCVLNNVPPEKRVEIVDAADVTAIKTHYPYYAGLEGLLNF